MGYYDYLKWISDLKDISKGKRRAFDTTKLEKDFIRFSSCCKIHQLVVHQPRLYLLSQNEKTHVENALNDLGVKTDKIPESIDISGGFNYLSGSDALIFASPQQMSAEHFSRTRSYLNPLIERVYSEGLPLISDFGLHEALCGRVKYSIGSLLLEEIALFPEKFQSSQYELSVLLDTPSKSLEKFKSLSQELKQLRQYSKAYLLHPSKVHKLTTSALQLRDKLGSLSRYEVPEKQEFTTKTNSCVIKLQDSTLFYLFSPQQNRNLLIYFGANPFKAEQSPPSDLIVLNGREHQNTLVKLLELDIVKPSKPVIEQRLHDFVALYEEATRATQTPLSRNHEEFSFIIEKLKSANTYFESVLNREMLKQFVQRQPSECVEFMVCPNSDDPIIHELLPRLSWNSSLRTYHHTSQFITNFEIATEEEKIRMIKTISANILFHNHQNTDINNWLYQNYRDICIKSGISFNLGS